MGKAKKGKKSEDDILDEGTMKPEEEAVPKKGKGKKKKKDDWMDDVANEIEALAIGDEKPRDLTENSKPLVHQTSQGEPVNGDASDKKSGDSSKSDFPKLENSEVGENVEPEVEKSDGRTKGKKKDRRKKRGGEDIDMEAALAELDQMEQSGTNKEEAETVVNKHIDDSKSDHNKSVKFNKEDIERKEMDDEEVGTVKTKAQKKKEKKERDKQKRMEERKAEKAATLKEENKQVEAPVEVEPEPVEDVTNTEVDPAVESTGKKKKQKKDKKEEKKKGPGAKQLAAMKEALLKVKQEEERLRKIEEARIKAEEEAERQRLEKIRLEQERKERLKQKKKERLERMKAEGRYLTAKQKADRARAEAMLEALRAQGAEFRSETTEKKPRLGTRVRVKKSAKPEDEETTDKSPEEEKMEVEVKEEPEDQEEDKEDEEVEEEEEEENEDVKDTWDMESDLEDEEDESKSEDLSVSEAARKISGEEEYEDSESETEESSEEEEEESSSEEDTTEAERRRERALLRIQKRREQNEKNRTQDILRAPVICVLGHVDTGKTKILDSLRRTNVQDREAGGITQQIGATNVPMEAVKDRTKMVKEMSELTLNIPGLLIIDTPGHESFSNLRSRGSSLCDMAILVVDLMHGLEPQTIESLNLLKAKKTPFVVALNKIDRLYDWKSNRNKDIRDVLNSQSTNTKIEFQNRLKQTILELNEQGLNAALFHENPDTKSYISLIPTSAITGDGMGNLMALIVELCQMRMVKRLMFSDELQATVLEVKAIEGLGTTIDVILVNGKLREGETVILAGTEGPIVTQIRALLLPQPMRELRVKGAYQEFKEVNAAQGVKIAGKDMEKAIAGLNILVADDHDEVEICKEEVAKELKSALSSIKLQERGVYVQASTLGSMEALLQFLEESKIPYSGVRIGPVVKKDVMKASIMLEHEEKFACILAFDVKIERDAQELADRLDVRIFQADIIYHLFDSFTKYCDELAERKREEFKHVAVFPCKLKILPQFIFNSRDPIVMGVSVEAGIVREGTPICVPSKENLILGTVTSVEVNHKPLESARKGEEVCVRIENTTGDAPKMYGRHFDETDLLVSKISRESIDACKKYFREQLIKSDWTLMIELKKTFSII